MASFVEEIITSIELLITRGYLEEKNYLDELLTMWYFNRSAEDKASHELDRIKAIKDRVVTNYENIRASYQLTENDVYISVPKIRLQSHSTCSPKIVVFSQPNNIELYNEIPLTFGDIVQTTYKKDIYLKDLQLQSSKSWHLQVIISDGKDIIYDSKERLFREAISFNDQGEEIRKRPISEYCNVMVPLKAKIKGLESVYPYQGTYGIKYRLLFDESTSITVNDTVLFPNEKTIGDLNISLSEGPLPHCRYLFHQKEYLLFNKSPKISITLNDPKLLKKYCFLVDNKELFSNQYQLDQNTLHIELPSNDGIHEFKIKELINHDIYDTLNYTVFEDFDLTCTGFYYHEKYEKNGYFSLDHDNKSEKYPYANVGKDYTVEIPFLEGDLSVSIPYFKLNVGKEENIANNDLPLWHENIQGISKLSLEIPRGYSGKLFFGNEELKGYEIELGNFIRTKGDEQIVDLSVYLSDNNSNLYKIKLFEIAFKPYFVNPPLFIDNHRYVWNAENNFIGNTDSEFKLQLLKKGKVVDEIILTTKNTKHEIDGDLEDGLYDYTIKIKKPGFFSKYEHFDEGHVILGDPNQFRFDDKAIVVTDGIIQDCKNSEKKEYLELDPTSGIITNIEYIGPSPLNGEVLSYHLYEGILKYKYKDRLYPCADSDYIKNGIHREQINPIKIWFINDYTIALRTPHNDGLHVHKGWKNITDRINCEGNVYCFPDYYRFKLIDEDEVSNV